MGCKHASEVACAGFQVPESAPSSLALHNAQLEGVNVKHRSYSQTISSAKVRRRAVTSPDGQVT
jgi:hypothetical protein